MPSDLLRRSLQALCLRLRAWPAGGGRPSRPETLILFFNSMWGEFMETGDVPLPEGYRITTDRDRFGEAAAVVFHMPTLHGPPVYPKAPGQRWIAWSMECDAHYPLMRDPDVMRLFDLTMTYRLDADIPILYTSYYGDVANLARALRTPPQPKSPDGLAALFISGHIDRSGRVAYAAELMRHLDIHSYGAVLKNRELVQDQGRATKLHVLGGYRFTLAFENAIGTDYVTEKFFDPLVAGSVPVYLGAPNAAAFAPGDHCFINAADFTHPRELATYLLHLQHDVRRYEDYFAWKTRPFNAAFQALLAGQAIHPGLRLCRAVQEQRRNRR